MQSVKQGIQAPSTQKVQIPGCFQGKNFKDRLREGLWGID